jgi:hypothetical protein
MNHSYSGIASRLGETKQGLTFAREGVRHARNPADGTRGDAFDDDVVEAGEQDKTIADHVAGVDETPRVAGGILEADDAERWIERCHERIVREGLGMVF